MTDCELADALEAQASPLLDTDPDHAEILLTFADELRADGWIDAVTWRAS